MTTVRSLDDLRAIEGVLLQTPDGPIVVDYRVDPEIEHPFFGRRH